MQDTTHKRAKTAVPRLVVVLVFCLYVALTLPSTTAAVVSVIRLEILHIALFRPDEVSVSSKDQLEFQGIDGDHIFRIQFSSSCRDDLVDDGVEVKDKTPINVNTLFSKTTSRTAYAAFESIGCKPGNMVKINLLDHVTPPNSPPKTPGTNSTASSSHAKNSTESSSSEGEHDRNANATTPRGNSRKVSGSSPSSDNEIGNANKHNEKKKDGGLSPTMAAVIGSAVTFGFAGVIAIGFLLYRRRTRATNDPGGKQQDDEPLTAQPDVTPDSPDNKEPNPYYPTVFSNAEASPNPYYPMVISNPEAPPNAYYPMLISNAEAPLNAYSMVISNAEAPPSPYLTLISNAEAPPNAYPTVISNAKAPPSPYYPTVISNVEAPPSPYLTLISNAKAPPNPSPTVISNNADAPPVYDDVVPRFVSYQMTTSLGESGGSDTNHEVITDSNNDVGQTSIDT